MTQTDRERLVALKKAADKKITPRQNAAELKISARQVRRMLSRLKLVGDKTVVHGLRGRSNRRLREEDQQKAIEVLSTKDYKGFGPTLASEYLAKKHAIVVMETVRKWMKAAGLWRSHKQKVVEIHMWRERRERYGELVQRDTSTHDWLEGRGDSA